MFPTPSADENVVRYRIFFRAHAATDNAVDLDAEDRAFVEKRCAAFTALAEAATRDFIWHKHGFRLSVVATHSVLLPTHGAALRRFMLQGETSVGDAIADEWVVTWLLVRLTAEGEDEDASDVIVQATDTDGEFLLIECADALPRWATPENTRDAVFLRRGELHLIPPTMAPSAAEPANENDHALATSLRLLCPRTSMTVASPSPAASTRAPEAMQRVLRHKLEVETREYMAKNRQRVRLPLPPRAAFVLRRVRSRAWRQQLLGAAVEAFYYRAPGASAMNVCHRMARFFPPSLDGPNKRLRTGLVAFSRCQYAQLMQQDVYAPRAFQMLIPDGYADARHAGVALRVMTRPQRAACRFDLGVKLACGLELLYASDACDQGGRAWRGLLDEVLAQYDDEQEMEDQGDEREEEDEDDAWMYLHPDSLEEKLQRAAVTKGKDGQEASTEELQEMATLFNSFVSGLSGVEGVVTGGGEEEEEEEDEDDVRFDMSSFMKILQGADFSGDAGLGGVMPSDGEDDDDWGDDEEDEMDDDEDEDEDEPEDEAEERLLMAAMDEMDAELMDGSTLSRTFTRVQTDKAPEREESKRQQVQEEGEEEEEQDVLSADDEDRPLDLDYNMLTNLLESLASQNGLAGPVSNMLGELSATP